MDMQWRTCSGYIVWDTYCISCGYIPWITYLYDVGIYRGLLNYMMWVYTVDYLLYITWVYAVDYLII